MPDLHNEAPPAGVTPSPLSPSGFSNHAIHLVRTAQQMQLTLSQMADAKASILMGATFVVFSIAVGQARGGALPWSVIVLACFAFASALCAVVAVLPSIGGKPAAGAKISRPNRLFFGVFSAMDEAEWTDSLVADMKADETVFRTMLHDIYQSGQVLKRKKYRFLTMAYMIFIAGLCATLITFFFERILPMISR